VNKIFVAFVALSAMVATAPALAADMPLKAPPPLPAPMWTGWYIGGNIGGSFGRASDSSSFAGAPFSSTTANLDGVLGGGQIGYNWQSGSWIFGLEADIQATSEQGTATSSVTGFVAGIAVTPVTGTLADTEKLPWLGTARARIGITPSPNWLLYGTGGLAYGEIDSNETLTVGTGLVTSNVNTIKAGWTVGAGVEGWLGSNWTAKLEYLYVDLGSVTNSFTGLSIFTPMVLNSHVTDNIVRAGLNYHFKY
jgi:outer membrane immunogenic protein